MSRIDRTLAVVMRQLLVIGWMLLGLGQAVAETSVSGPVSADAVWRAADGPFVVTSDVTIANGATLSIEPGTTVYMTPGSNLVVSAGGLQALGTAALPVRITSKKIQAGQPAAPGDWGQLRFLSGTVAGKTKLDYALIEYGQGISLQGASPTLNHVAVNSHSAAAIAMDLASSPQGDANSASGNVLNAITVPAGVILGTVKWNLRGIPFVVANGRISVGVEPAVTSASPGTLEQGEQATLSLSGSRLSGLGNVIFNPPMTDVLVQSGGTDSAAAVAFKVPGNAAPGPVGLTALTDAGEVVMSPAFAVNAMQVPVVSGVIPRTVPRSAESTIMITGTSLASAQVKTSAPGLTVSGLNATRTSLSFRLNVGVQAAIGTTPLQVANTAGSATVNLDVVPEALPPPPFEFIPTMVVLAPDSVYRGIVFRAAQTSAQERRYSVAVDLPTIAKAKAAEIVVAAGQYEAVISVAGVAAGTTTLRVSGGDLVAPLEAPINVVSGGFSQLMTSRTVGLDKGSAVAQATQGTTTSRTVGLDKGSPVAQAAKGAATSRTVGLDKGSPVAQAAQGAATSRTVGLDKGSPVAQAAKGEATSRIVGVIKQ